MRQSRLLVVAVVKIYPRTYNSAQDSQHQSFERPVESVPHNDSRAHAHDNGLTLWFNDLRLSHGRPCARATGDAAEGPV
jgi:hypothetical protein